MKREMTPNDVRKIIDMRLRGISKKQICSVYGLYKEQLDEILGDADDELFTTDIWLVKDATCKGCTFYAHGSGTKTCDYTLYTGHARTMPPCDCIYKTNKAIMPIVISKYEICGKAAVKPDETE